jgi:hypothetical protein
MSVVHQDFESIPEDRVDAVNDGFVPGLSNVLQHLISLFGEPSLGVLLDNLILANGVAVDGDSLFPFLPLIPPLLCDQILQILDCRLLLFVGETNPVKFGLHR